MEPIDHRAAADHCRVRLDPPRDASHHPELDEWRANVGAPVAIDRGTPAPARLTGADVICWNMAIGLGRLDALLDALRVQAHVASEPSRPLVILAQEAYRADDTVPPAAAGRRHGGLAPRNDRFDIAALAASHGLSLRYSPSMRNGVHRSDRGNAVLCSAPLSHAHAWLLPHVRQRRVAVSARMAGHPRLSFMSAHLDTHGRARRVPLATERSTLRTAGGRATQARALGAIIRDIGHTVVLGADLNSMFGMSDVSVRELVAAGLHPARRSGSWRHTFHTPVRMLLDHVMFTREAGSSIAVSVVRIDEEPRDRSRTVFGSDHHPLLARIEFEN